MALEDFRKERIKKLERIVEAGLDPYPAHAERTHSMAVALERFDALASANEPVVLAGRVMAQRGHGGLTFLDIDDGSGTIQALVSADRIGQKEYDFCISVIDVGDIVEVSGILAKTKRGERSVEVTAWRMLAKAIRPLPEKWHGLTDVEERFRQRHVDLIFNRDVRSRLESRFRIISSIRRFFEDLGYTEVETPVLQLIAGGATARPFQTHLNALDLDMYLRVAPELFLKRLLVGGFERVFEIGKNFRNEGMDRDHNPEFTMLEAYAAYQDHEWLMGVTEDLLVALVAASGRKHEITYQGTVIPVKKPFARMDFADLVHKASGLEYASSSADDFAKKARELGVVVEKTMTKAVLADEIYKKTLRHTMLEPVFVVGHPLELSPFAKKISRDSDTVARFQLLVGGFELTNGFAELNDPLDQMERFEAQQKLRDKGDEEAHRVDMDFISALEYGMPPAAGIGIGIDRLVALLTDAYSLRDILPFPTMKPIVES